MHSIVEYIASSIITCLGYVDYLVEIFFPLRLFGSYLSSVVSTAPPQWRENLNANITDAGTIYIAVSPTFLVLIFRLLLFFGTVSILKKLYKLFFYPLNRVKKLSDVGYANEGNASKEEAALLVQRRRSVGMTPPVYPNGWFSVLESSELERGEAKSVFCLGKNLAVFRGENGTAYVIDAYCPHMGANLGVGGQVKEDCLQCPFHGWKFRGYDGKCIGIPYCENKYIPSNAHVYAYNVLERNGFVYFWHHSEDAEPTWEPPVIEEIKNKQWTYRGRTEHYVNAHVEEIPENGADLAHLVQVHGPYVSSGVDMRKIYNRAWSFAWHQWIGTWSQDETRKHVGILKLNHKLMMFGRNVPFLNLDLSAEQIGPGIVYLTFDSFMGKGAFLQSLTPTEPLVQKLVHHIYFQKSTPTFVAKIYLLSESIMVERDLMIWNNKKYEMKPVLVKSPEDSSVAKHRRWYSQFYSKNESNRQNGADLNLDW